MSVKYHIAHHHATAKHGKEAEIEGSVSHNGRLRGTASDTPSSKNRKET